MIASNGLHFLSPFTMRTGLSTHDNDRWMLGLTLIMLFTGGIFDHVQNPFTRCLVMGSYSDDCVGIHVRKLHFVIDQLFVTRPRMLKDPAFQSQYVESLIQIYDQFNEKEVLLRYPQINKELAQAPNGKSYLPFESIIKIIIKELLRSSYTDDNDVHHLR